MSKASAERRNALPASSTKQVLYAVGNEHLELVRGNGYWYFIYDDAAKGRFNTTSIYTMYLRDFTVNAWADMGREFVAKMESDK